MINDQKNEENIKEKHPNSTISKNLINDNHLEGILTKRELVIATSIVQNETNKYIAHKLHISEGTVKRMVYNIYQKLGITSRVELTKLFYNCMDE
ncbi:response regulator transcription factor [Lachnoclostridium phytofermentans]|uniref:Transcriptional regulator, LuxR family n=1 Tax=Lachnoclostridium phytofermentans (strain ATCC 700394 / DSM 18823 / ISDg) TaxID=357809 RepID=A9KQR5_LACP7|nr:LuxR C-terminal-related transcriptional regulator [Lachnoclostridium phytofermentans]ABX41978.1 transcriptional regulator, LuxR family [Lachnoclostridium phytofermentans ISDg]